MLSRGNHICKHCHKKQVRERGKYVPNDWKEAPKGHGRKSLPPEEEALQMIREGISGAEVAKRIGVSQTTVSNWRNAAGLSGKRGGRAKNTPHHSTRPHDPGIKEEALQMIRDGITGVEVAKRLGVHKGTVRKWRKAAGLTGNSGQTPGGGTSPLKEEGLQMIRDGISGAEVARRLGVHRGTVSNWRKSADLSGVDGREYHSVEQENNVIDLLRDGKSQAEISRTTGIGAKKISAWKKQAEKEGFL